MLLSRVNVTCKECGSTKFRLGVAGSTELGDVYLGPDALKCSTNVANGSQEVRVVTTCLECRCGEVKVYRVSKDSRDLSVETYTLGVMK